MLGQSRLDPRRTSSDEYRDSHTLSNELACTCMINYRYTCMVRRSTLLQTRFPSKKTRMGQNTRISKVPYSEDELACARMMTHVCGRWSDRLSPCTSQLGRCSLFYEHINIELDASTASDTSMLNCNACTLPTNCRPIVEYSANLNERIRSAHVR